jgi:hypothetical protein
METDWLSQILMFMAYKIFLKLMGPTSYNTVCAKSLRNTEHVVKLLS